MKARTLTEIGSLVAYTVILCKYLVKSVKEALDCVFAPTGVVTSVVLFVCSSLYAILMHQQGVSERDIALCLWRGFTKTNIEAGLFM